MSGDWVHASCHDTVSRAPGSVGTGHTGSQSSALWLPEDTTMYMERAVNTEQRKIFILLGMENIRQLENLLKNKNVLLLGMENIQIKSLTKIAWTIKLTQNYSIIKIICIFSVCDGDPRILR